MHTVIIDCIARVPAGLAGGEGGEELDEAGDDRPPPMISTRTSAVGPGQASATTPAARSASPSSRCPMTGPTLRLLNARAACSPAAMNA